MRWPAMTPREYDPLDEQALKELRESGVCAPFEKEYVRKDGWRVPILLGIVKLGDKPLQWLAFVMDLSQRKRSAGATQATEERFRLLVEGVRHYALYMLDLQGVVITWNSGA